jgi:hypothetical protein
VLNNDIFYAELFGRPSPSPSPRTSLKSVDSGFENTSDSDSACLFFCLRIYTVKKSTFHKKNPKFQYISLKSYYFLYKPHAQISTIVKTSKVFHWLITLGQGVGKSRFLKSEPESESESEFRNSVWVRVRVRRNGRVRKALILCIASDNAIVLFGTTLNCDVLFWSTVQLVCCFPNLT